MKSLYLVLFTLTVYLNPYATQTHAQYIINGTVSNNFDDYIYLNYNDIIDSVYVKDNQFNFRGSVDYPVEAIIRTKNGLVANGFYLENTDIKLKIKIKNKVTYITEVEGSKTQEMSNVLMNFLETNYGNENFSAQLYTLLDTLITNNPKNQFSGNTLSDILMEPIFSYEEAESLYSKLDTSTLQKEILEEMNAAMKKLKTMVVGKKFPAFEVKGIDENLIRVDDYRGSVVLIEFWASHCGHCRKANPKLAEIYATYQSKGFDILGISIDHDKKAWQNAIKRDQLNWTNTIVENGYDNPLLKSLTIQYIPSNFLLDKAGHILAVNVKPDKLNELLADVLK